MNENFPIDIILFAMIAVFLVLRLRSVLGRRDGHEGDGHRDPFNQPDVSEREDSNIVQLSEKSKSQDFVNQQNETAEKKAPKEEPSSIPGINDIRKAAPAFSEEEFLSGAKLAFEMILGAFAVGDVAALRPLLNSEVMANFKHVIKDREDNEYTQENSLIGIKEAEIVEASVDKNTANVTVKFVSDQVNVTRDKDGDAIEGDPKTVTQIIDFWTFSHKTKSRNPNWVLIATRSLD
jgi:predicted lipid-binding transport protein (Tim44 family)